MRQIASASKTSPRGPASDDRFFALLLTGRDDPLVLSVEAGTLLPAAPSSRIGVRRGSRTVIVEVSDIDWIEAADDYSRLHVGSDAHLISTRIHELESRLPESFFRIHRSAIVNVDRVAELRRDPNGGGLAILREGVQLRVARSRWDAHEEAIGI